MKNLLHRVVIIFFAISAAAIHGAPDTSEPVKLPSQIHLSDGRVLKNPTLSKQTSEAVILKHAGGLALIRYEYLPASVRPLLERTRPGGSRLPAGDTAADKQEIKGQAFIQTRGSGPYKFGNIPIYAFPETALHAWGSAGAGPIRLPVPLAKTVTDADGKFVLAVPMGSPFFLFAQATRLMLDGSTEKFEWRAPSAEIKIFDQVNLSSEWRHPMRPVTIETLE